MSQDELVNNIEEIYFLNVDIKNYKKIVIWHGENVIEQLSLRYLVDRFKNYDLYEVNVSSNIKETFVRAVAECFPDNLDSKLKGIFKIYEKRKKELISEWKLLRESKENLRILINNQIVGVSEDYYDHLILENITTELIKASKIIGIVMAKSDQLVGDAIIDYRVREMIKMKKIEYRGKLGFMSEFEIKVKIN